jgi:hypothetical protein
MLTPRAGPAPVARLFRIWSIYPSQVDTWFQLGMVRVTTFRASIELVIATSGRTAFV